MPEITPLCRAVQCISFSYGLTYAVPSASIHRAVAVIPVSQRIWTPQIWIPRSISASGFGPLSRIWTPLLKSLGVTKLHPAIIDCCLNLDKSAGIPRSTQTTARSAEISVHSSLYSGKPPREISIPRSTQTAARSARTTFVGS